MIVVERRPDGGWEVDWEVPEPEDLPPPGLGWQLWHVAWWWSMVLDHSFGEGALTRETFEWSGPERGFDQIALELMKNVGEMHLTRGYYRSSDEGRAE